MKLSFNTTGNNQTNGRTTRSILLGKLRNTLASTSRKFKFCNTNSPDLNVTFNCVFNGLYNPSNIDNFVNYHILNDNEISIDILIEDNLEEDSTGIIPLNKAILFGPFTPSQIKKAYSINTIIPMNNIRRPIVTIISAYNNPYLVRDVTRFGEVFGLPKCNLKIWNFSRYFSTGWAVETTLDVQWVYAINPYAEIRVILAASSSWNDMFNAVNFANNKKNFSPAIDTDIISMSWGTTDNGGLTGYNSYFSNPNTIYLASSGDSSRVSFPSSCTNVVSIGGTSLNLNSNLTRASEKVWGSAGCGLSKSFTKPSYQPIINNNTSLRITPDISCVADPNTACFIVINNRLYSVGGTSLSSPIYAGMLSLITQNRLNNKKTTYTSVTNKANSIQPLLYNSNNFDCFFDITQGSSGSNQARVGFDSASGLGVMNEIISVGKLG